MSTQEPLTKHLRGLKTGNIFDKVRPGIAESVIASLILATALRNPSDSAVVEIFKEIRKLAEGTAKASKAWEGIQRSPYKLIAENLFPSKALPLLHILGQLFPLIVEPATEAVMTGFPKDRRSLASLFENVQLVQASELVLIETGAYHDQEVAELMARIYESRKTKEYEGRKVENFEKALPTRRNRLKRDYPLIYQQAREWAERLSSQY